jgi:predicted flap endonuclease-1-like 5' DNA nuclease
MNPIIVVAGFVVLLALLLYYMYKEKVELAAPDEPKMEPSVVKVRDYEAKLAAEKPAEAPAEAPEEPPAEQPEEPEPGPAEPTPEEPQPESVTDDLESLTGVGEKYRALLRVAGVGSVAMLAGEEPSSLLERLREANEREGLVKRLPRVGDVEAWVQRAKEQSL